LGQRRVYWPCRDWRQHREGRDLQALASGSALCLDACKHLGSKPTLPDPVNLKEDPRTLVLQMADSLRNSAAAVPSIIDMPEIARLRAAATLDYFPAQN
jgi:hypothetical protein